MGRDRHDFSGKDLATLSDAAHRRFACRTTALIVLVVLGPQVSAQNPRSNDERQRDLLSFDEVRKTVKEGHWDALAPGLDWDAEGAEYRQRVAQAHSAPQVRAIMREMLGHLKRSHFEIHAAHEGDEPDPALWAEAQEGTSGMEVRAVDGKALVWRVMAGSSAERAGVRPGWCVDRINGREIAPQLREVKARLGARPDAGYELAWAVMRQLSGPVDKAVSLTFLDGKDESNSRAIPLDRRAGRPNKLANMPVRYVWFHSRMLRARVAYVTFNTWVDGPYLAGKLRECLATLKRPSGVVIDLRGSRGGVIQVAQDLAGYFIRGTGRTLGVMRSRHGSFSCTIVPKEEVYDGPVAILVDALSRSASEIFASGMREERRARLFGSRTAGCVSPSMVTRLANGDNFQYAVAQFTTVGGEYPEGVGVDPDVDVPLSRQDLLADRDPALDAAVDWIIRVCVVDAIDANSATPERCRLAFRTGSARLTHRENLLDWMDQCAHPTAHVRESACIFCLKGIGQTGSVFGAG
jgi:carboxyl-terminal processing protease